MGLHIPENKVKKRPELVVVGSAVESVTVIEAPAIDSTPPADIAAESQDTIKPAIMPPVSRSGRKLNTKETTNNE